MSDNFLEALKTFLPLIVVVVTGAIGVATYTWQENIKRQTEIVERRQKLYEDLNGALFGLILATTPAERRNIIAQIEKGWLFASDDVLAALFKYMELYDELWVQAAGNVRQLIREDKIARKNLEQSMSDLFLAMRQDLRRTKIPTNLARQYMHFYQCGMLDLN
ncbi:hypothetical protein [Chamaesiphon minutus]|uniref:Uncharacterized protein n=1 Tax=Chamaesiphon minutus (strain ATCC 27169 / PCC 6605) TaxID=1173020 RepID=K9UHU8_CHAP6|nr:hypothetical protein [Chamaesiphon minutus]AFY94375.1 hypothetical protein Cha6605_3373 [Chamaesiphon minutus PCC 6605]